jgi:hypothetical protein
VPPNQRIQPTPFRRHDRRDFGSWFRYHAIAIYMVRRG